MKILGMEYLPHRVCYLSDPVLIGIMNATDLLIALAYFSIPALLVIAAARRRRAGRVAWPLHAFSIFIFLCGCTHVMDLIGVWIPWYGLDAMINGACAIASVATTLAMLPRRRYRDVLEGIVRSEEWMEKASNCELRYQQLVTRLRARGGRLDDGKA